jgi:hypothetical protein
MHDDADESSQEYNHSFSSQNNLSNPSQHSTRHQPSFSIQPVSKFGSSRSNMTSSQSVGQTQVLNSSRRTDQLASKQRHFGTDLPEHLFHRQSHSELLESPKDRAQDSSRKRNRICIPGPANKVFQQICAPDRWVSGGKNKFGIWLLILSQVVTSTRLHTWRCKIEIISTKLVDPFHFRLLICAAVVWFQGAHVRRSDSTQKKFSSVNFWLLDISCIRC